MGKQITIWYTCTTPSPLPPSPPCVYISHLRLFLLLCANFRLALPPVLNCNAFGGACKLSHVTFLTQHLKRASRCLGTTATTKMIITMVAAAMTN